MKGKRKSRATAATVPLRERTVGVRVTDVELDRWVAAAERAGHNVSTWVRFVANQAARDEGR